MSIKSHNIHIIGFIIISLYLVLIQTIELNTVSTIFATLATMIAGIAIWVQLKRESDLKEAEFIMEYNSKFIFDENFTSIQQALEKHRNKEITDQELKSIERQKIVNYLVYLEAISPLINNSSLNLETIDNLFSYRFFLAMNNPVIQEIELEPDAEYYKGCYLLHAKWEKYKKKNGLPIILEESSLRNTSVYKSVSK